MKDENERERKLVELNVVEQCINVFKTGIVQRKRLENQRKGDTGHVPRIHALVFDMSNGLLKKLRVNYDRIGNLQHIYNLY